MRRESYRARSRSTRDGRRGPQRSFLSGAAACLGLMACGPGGFWAAYEDPIGSADGGSRGGIGGSAGEAPLAAPSLQAVSSCDELLEAIQARLFTEVRMRQEYARAWDGAVNA